jgi:hypothetical protein
MQFGISRFTRTVSLALLVISAVYGMAATNYSRAFNGRYQLSNIVEQGTEVEVTMTLTLVNCSKTTIKGGIVAVLSSDPDPVLIGSFSPIASLPATGQITISQRLTVSAAEYQSWQVGHAPRLQFLVGSGGSPIAADIAAYRWLPPGSRTK